MLFLNSVKNKGYLTSDQAISDAVETTAAEAILTVYRESMEGQQHQVTCIALIVVNNWYWTLARSSPYKFQCTELLPLYISLFKL